MKRRPTCEDDPLDGMVAAVQRPEVLWLERRAGREGTPHLTEPLSHSLAQCGEVGLRFKRGKPPGSALVQYAQIFPHVFPEH